MEQSIITKQTVKKNAKLKKAQQEAKKYYGDKWFQKKQGETKAVIRKSVFMNEVPYKDFTKNEKMVPVERKPISTKEELIKLCRVAELTGRSGNGFPTEKKLESYQDKGGVLLINGVECDPGLIHDAWIYRNRLKQVEEGAKILHQIFHFKKIILATKEPIQMSNAIFDQVKIKDRFPMGYENYLIRTVFGINLAKEERPSEKGILVLNLQTVLAIYELSQNIENGAYKYITVADMRTAKAYVAKVELGSKVTEIVSAIFTDRIMEQQIFVGGGAMNCHNVQYEEVIEPTTSFIGVGELPDYEHAKNCIKCGKCTRNCPAGVFVRDIVLFAEKNGRNKKEEYAKYHPERCIQCGVCTYGCMAGKDIRGIVAWAK